MAVIFTAAVNLPGALFLAFVSATNPTLGFLPTVFAAHVGLWKTRLEVLNLSEALH